MNTEVLKFIDGYAKRKVWVPVTIAPNGKLENAKQAQVFIEGAKPGETNYKTRKVLTKYGNWKTGQGTRLANQHIKFVESDTQEVDPDGRFTRLGAYRHVHSIGNSESAMFAAACRNAAEIISRLSNSAQGGNIEETPGWRIPLN